MPEMTSPRDATIIGGGVIGLSIAWELAKRGLRVLLLERDQVGRATSWAGGGILPPANLARATDPIDRLRGLSHAMYADWVDQLESATGIDCGFRRCGGWYLADSAGERAAMIGMTGYWHELGIHCDSVSHQTLLDREPALTRWSQANPLASAWWVPEEYQIRPPRYLLALRLAGEQAGVQLMEETSVTEIKSGDQAPRVVAGGREYASDLVVLCAGAWTGRLAANFGLRNSLVPVRGQMLLLKTARPLLGAIVNVGHRYIIPRDDGYTLVGSCEEEKGFSLGTTESVLSTLRDFAFSLVPDLRAADEIDAWSGLRPMTFDGFPMIGRVPEQPHLYVAAGHFRSGLHLAPATAVCLADLILGRDPPVSLDSFGVGKQQTKTANVLDGDLQ